MNNTLLSYSDFDNLVKILNGNYKLHITQIYLHREMIGYVYIAANHSKKYVLKLYRHFYKEQALQSINIIEYLKENHYPVVSIVPTYCGNSYVELSTPQGQCAAILYDYIEGIEPNLKEEIELVGRQTGWLHSLMKDYNISLIHREKEFYIDRFIMMLKELQYSDKRVQDLEQYGCEIWYAMSKLPHGFCHGDLHSGNMFRTAAEKYIFFDFDTASEAYPVIDIAVLCNRTGFNHLKESEYDSTMTMLERFYKGYSKEKTVSDVEIVAIMNFIAARHYELIATITECEGMDSLGEPFLDQQYEWLMSWRDICSRLLKS